MKLFGYELSEIKKFLAAVIGFVIIVGTQVLQFSDVLGPTPTAVITMVVGAATAASVYLLPNGVKGLTENKHVA